MKSLVKVLRVPSEMTISTRVRRFRVSESYQPGLKGFVALNALSKTEWFTQKIRNGDPVLRGTTQCSTV